MLWSRNPTSSIRSRIWQLAILACTTLVALTLVLAWTLERTREANAQVVHTQTVRKALADYTRALIAAETGQRGYLLTHQDIYLVPYRQVLADNKALLAHLNELVLDGPAREKLPRMAVVFDDKLAELAATVRLAQAGNMKGALALVLAGTGRRDTIEFQLLAKQIADRETYLLAARQASAAADDKTVLVFGGLSSLLALILIFAAAKRIVARIDEPMSDLMAGIAALADGDLGRRIDVQSRDEIGKLAVAVNTMADRLVAANEARELADNAVREREARLNSILSAVPDAIYMFDEFGTVEFFDAGARRLFGYAEEEIIGQNVRMLFPQSIRELHDAFILHLRETGEQKTTHAGRTAIGQRKDGIIFPMEWALVAVLSGERRLFTGFVRDITERHRVEVELKEAMTAAQAASLAKSDFLSSMSHELRTPLNAILGFTQLMASDEPAPTPNQKLSIDHILKASWYLLSLINEVLDLELIESGKLTLSPEPVSVSEVLGDCKAMMEPLAQNRCITMTFPSFDESWLVAADRTRLKQVFVNLLSNAIKYNRSNGSIDVRCSEQGAGQVRISVTDTGKGLPPEKLSQLYQAFNRLGHETGVEQGTGIGLVVTKRLVEAMQGRIGAESEVGVGTTFWVEFAAASSAQNELADGATLLTAKFANDAPAASTVLYVEDNPDNLKLVEMLLGRRANTRVLSAGTGDLGIELAQAHRPDVILMDINLPGISGVDALAALRRDPATAHIPVIALSANASPRNIERCLAAGFFRYLIKPINVDELLSILDLAFEEATCPTIPRAA